MLEEKDPDQKKTRHQREREEEVEEEVIKRNGSEEDGSKKTGFQTGDSARISFRRCHPGQFGIFEKGFAIFGLVNGVNDDIG